MHFGDGRDACKRTAIVVSDGAAALACVWTGLRSSDPRCVRGLRAVHKVARVTLNSSVKVWARQVLESRSSR
jgi:hypothetical protein